MNLVVFGSITLEHFQRVNGLIIVFNNLLPIFFSLRGNIYQYSFHKYASNVVERCITFGNEPQKKEIINEIAELVNRDEEIIINMVRDKFANYVVQKIIEFSDGDMQQSLIKIIQNFFFVVYFKIQISFQSSILISNNII